MRLVVIDIHLTARTKRAIQWILVPLAAFGGTVAIAKAALNPAPSAWAVSGRPVSAADLQQNLTDLDARLAKVEGQVAKPVVNAGGHAPWSLGAGLCGQTAPTNGQITGGYAGAKSLCEAACSSPSAHMCTSEELVHTVQTGTVVGAVWYAGGVASGNASDCAGWTSSSSSLSGAYWAQPPTQPETDICSNARNVACCD